MCFNYSLNTSIKSLEARFGAQSVKEQFGAVYHASAFTYPKMPVITNESTDKINYFNWGLVPSWVKNDSKADDIKKFTLNARSETVFEKPSFKNSIFSRRCLIPATGFFEWQHIRKEKIPWYIFLPEQSIFSFAGIWDSYMNDNEEEFQSFSILTCEANSFMANIHNTKKRMPVILTPQEESVWLNEGLTKNEINDLTNKKYIDLDAYTIKKSLGNPKIDTDTIDILQRINYEDTTLGL